MVLKRYGKLLWAALLLWCQTGFADGGKVAESFDMPCPDGMSRSRLMTLSDAWRQTTPTRERISLNGLWEFHPVLAPDELEKIPGPETGWGWFKVPGAWPTEPNGMSFYLKPEVLSRFKAAELNSAWYRREIDVPEEWKGRRIRLSADLIQSCGIVFVDGVKAGVLYYPGGELELTGKLLPGSHHTLAVLVSAKPEEQLEYMGHDRLVKLKSNLRNRGICGDLYLESLPLAAAISDVHVITSVKSGRITFDTGFVTLPAGTYRLEAEVSEGRNVVRTFASEPFAVKDGENIRRSFGGLWNDPKLWDIDTPQNLYVADVKLLSAGGEILDRFLPQEFGFREFSIDGRDFYLNGKKIHLRALVTPAPQEADLGSAGRIDHMVRTARQFGANFLIGWNYSFAPGVFAYPAGYHRYTSERGMLTSLTLPHIKDFGNDLENPANLAEYRRQTEHLIRRFQNIPGVIMYVMNHNRLGYMGDQNPLRIGNDYRPERYIALPVRKQGRIAEKTAKAFDASRPVYHHESGNFGDVCSLNCYLNWVPRQERGDWLEPWENNGTMPVFFVEWGLPHVASWSSWRGPEFIWNSKVLQCLWVNEYNAAILGEEAYRFEEAKRSLYDLQAAKTSGNRPAFFYDLGANGNLTWIEDVRRVRAWFASKDFPNLRARGISGLLPWDQAQLWNWFSRGEADRDNPVRFENLKRPGLVPDRIESRGEAINNPVAKFRLNVAGETVRKNFQEFLCRIAGRVGDFTENGHNFHPGETIRKSLQLLNDSRRDAEIGWNWSVPEFGFSGTGSAIVPPGGRTDIPLEFTVPENTVGKAVLRAEFKLPSGEKLEDSFALDLFAAPSAAGLRSQVGLYDPEGSAAPLLQKLGVPFRRVANRHNLDGVELLVIGRNGLKDFPFELSGRLESGLKLLLLEQNAEELRRIGLRCVEFGMREAFLPDGGKLHDWRGSSTMLPFYRRTDDFESNYPLVNANFFRRTRPWRAGNRGSLADVVVEKPQIGDWLPAASCGFDLQYAPLLRLTEGRGCVMLCQYAVSGRTESDPEAGKILAQALVDLDRYEPAARRTVFYSGDEAGSALLKALHIPFAPYCDAASLPENALLVVGPGGAGEKLSDLAAAGMNILALGLSAEELNRAFPGEFQTENGEFYSDYIPGLAKIPEFAGIGNAELHWRGKVRFDAFSPDSPGGRMLSRKKIGKGCVIAMQLPPWKFSETEFSCRTTRRRTAYLASRLLANLGAAYRSGFFAMLDRTAGRREFELPNDCWQLCADPQDRGERQGWQKASFRPGRDWRKVRVPGWVEEQFPELARGNGRFWLRLEFTLPPGLAERLDELFLGSINQETHVWINGIPIGSETGEKRRWITREYRIPAGVLKTGRNVLTIRCVDTEHQGGILNLPFLKGAAGKSFYTDIPEAADDPYGYFRW